MVFNKLRIYLKVYDYILLDELVKRIVEFVKKSGVIVVGLMFLFIKIRKYIVLRLVYVNKDLRE